MFRKKTNENREILLQSFYNLEDKITEKLGINDVIVAFTASSNDTKKSDAIVDMAKHIAEDGERVLVIDGNLRDPHLENIINEEKEIGFIDIILGDKSIDDAIINDDILSDLDYITTGKVINYADKFLEPSDIKAFFDEVRDRYNYVFIDLTPNIDVPEANMFASLSDRVAVFTSYELSNNPILNESIKALEAVNADILGTIITGYIYSEDEIDDLFGGNDE